MKTFSPRKRTGWIWVFYFLCVVFVVQTAAAEKTITPEIVASLKTVTEVALSPDGRWIAYTVRSPREEGEKPGGYHYQIWLVNVKEGKPRPLTAKAFNSRAISWFKDSRRIAFLSKRGKDAKQQIYTIRIDGGEAEALTHEVDGISNYKFSPSEKMIAFTRRDKETKEEKENKKKGRDWRVVDKHYKYNRLYILDLEKEETRLLTEEDLHVIDYSWAPGGTELVFTATKRPLTDDTYMFKKIYRIPVTGGKAEVAVETEGKLGMVEYSPDGKKIAWLGALHIHDSQAQSLFIASLDDGKKKNLTPNYEGSATWFKWLDNETIAMTSVEKTSTHLYYVDVKSGKKKHIRRSRPVFSRLSYDSRHQSYAFAGSTPFHPNEVFYVSEGSKPARRMTHTNPILEELKLADQFTIEYRAEDGLLITGLVMKPVDYEKGKRYPLIVSPHGGPETAVVDGWNTYYVRWGQLLAANGFVVFWPNYRGSTGRGVAYAMKDQKDLGGMEFRDVLAGIKYLADELGLVDKSRVGIGGASYGGYFSALGATRYSEHFKAAINFAGISNWISFTGTSDIPMENSLVHWGFKIPYDHLDKMWEGSPMKYINRCRTAVLIAHGERDLRVPISQGWEMYTALKVINMTKRNKEWTDSREPSNGETEVLEPVPVEFVIYPREGHGLREREHQIDFMKRALDWFNRYVK